MIRGGYEERSDRSGCFGGDRAAAGKFVHRPQESDGREARSGERRLGAGGRRPATAGGLDPQFGGDGERICGAGANRFRRDRKARSALLGAHSPAEKIAANGQLDSALGRLLVVVENYPQLKSNENFLRLQ